MFVFQMVHLSRILVIWSVAEIDSLSEGRKGLGAGVWRSSLAPGKKFHWEILTAIARAWPVLIGGLWITRFCFDGLILHHMFNSGA
jgi:hypothetical protein